MSRLTANKRKVNMDATLFKNLDECKAKESWMFVRGVVCAQLMGEGVFGVPFLEESQPYDIGGVILKEARSPSEKLGRRTPGTLPVGSLMAFTEPGTPSHIASREIVQSTREETGLLNQEFVFEEQDMKKGVKKVIRVEIKGCQKCEITVPIESKELFMIFEKRGYEHLTKFYFIHTVFYATNVKVFIQIKDETNEFELDKKIPLGFKLSKLTLDPTGKVALKPEAVNPDKWRVHWIRRKHFRNPMDRLPAVPGEDVQDHSGEDADGYITLPGACASRSN